ncbi:MAG TPA: MBL fold metallo-hydrolase [Thermoplasmata archaeon]
MSGDESSANAEYDFEPIAEGIVFARALRSGTALSNSAIVDLGATTLVFDTGLTLRAARELWAESGRASGRGPGLVVNSHWHFDHLLGNQLFAGAEIYATNGTIEYLLRNRSDLEQELTVESIGSLVREIESAGPGSATPTAAQVEEYEVSLKVNRQLLQEAPGIRLTPPVIPFEAELDLPGGRSARLLTFGPGHTESDGLLWLPKERVLFAGDLVVSKCHPSLLTSQPEHWLEVLAQIERLGPRCIVPGHGPLATVETIAEVRSYIETLTRLAKDSGQAGLPEEFRSWTDPGIFPQNVAYLRRRAKATSEEKSGVA